MMKKKSNEKRHKEQINRNLMNNKTLKQKTTNKQPILRPTTLNIHFNTQYLNKNSLFLNLNQYMHESRVEKEIGSLQLPSLSFLYLYALKHSNHLYHNLYNTQMHQINY